MTERRRPEVGFLWSKLEGSGVQSAAVVDPSSNCHRSSQERLVAVSQNGEQNFYWLLSVWWAGSREAWRRVARWLAGLAPAVGAAD